MIKWFAQQLSKGFDTDPEHVNRVTVKDATVGVPILVMLIWFITIPLLPLIILIELFEFVSALVLLACIFAAPITLYAIIDGRGTIMTWVIFIASSWGLLARYVFIPIIKQHPSYKHLVRRFS